MNKKQLNKLDPKLKEKYERIMSTPTQPEDAVACEKEHPKSDEYIG